MVSFPSPSDVARHSAFFLIIGLLIFSPLLDGGTTHLAAMIMRLLLLSAFCVYVFRAIVSRVLLIPRMAVGTPVLLFLGLVLGSTVYSPYANQSVQWMIVLLSYAGLLYLLAVFVQGWEGAAALRTVLVVMALAEAVSAFVQYFQGRMPRPSGTFFNPNFLAGYLATVFVLLLASICYFKIWHPQSWSTWQASIRSSVPVIVLLIILLAVAQTGSRGGVLALVAGTAVIIASRFGRRGLIGLFLLVAAIALVPNPVRDRAMTEHLQNPFTYARWHMWQGAVQEMVEHPFGVGVGLYQYVYPRHAVPIESELFRYGKVAQTTHSEYLQIGVELGVFGLGLFIWGLLRVSREAIFLLQQRLTRQQRGLVLGATAGIVVIVTQAMVDSNLHEPAIAILLACCVGTVTLGSALRRSRGLPYRTVMIRLPILWGTIAVVVITSLGTHVLRMGLAYQLYEAGTSLANQQQLEEAFDSFRGAIRLDPGKSLYHNSLAGMYFQVYQRTHQSSMAHASIEELRTAIALNPLDGRLQGLLGRVLASQAVSSLSEGLTGESRLWLEQAVEAYQEASQREPYAYAYPLELGRLMLLLDRRAEAERYFKHVIRLEPNFLPAREAWARLCAESGRKEMAEKEYQEILSRQRQLGPRVTNMLERSFLQVDTTGLEALLARKASSI